MPWYYKICFIGTSSENSNYPNCQNHQTPSTKWVVTGAGRAFIGECRGFGGLWTHIKEAGFLETSSSMGWERKNHKAFVTEVIVSLFRLVLKKLIAQSAGSVEYIDFISTRGKTTWTSVLSMILNNLVVRLQSWSSDVCGVPYIAIVLWSTLALSVSTWEGPIYSYSTFKLCANQWLVLNWIIRNRTDHFYSVNNWLISNWIFSDT